MGCGTREEILKKLNQDKSTPLHSAVMGGNLKVGTYGDGHAMMMIMMEMLLLMMMTTVDDITIISFTYK